VTVADVDQGDGVAGASGSIGNHPEIAPTDRFGAGPWQRDFDALGTQERPFVRAGAVGDVAYPGDDGLSVGDPRVAFRIDRDVVERRAGLNRWHSVASTPVVTLDRSAAPPHDPERLPDQRHRARFESSPKVGDLGPGGRVEGGDAVRGDGGDGTGRRSDSTAPVREDRHKHCSGSDNG
jgi:hypothetical protein